MTNQRMAMRFGMTCDKGLCVEKISKDGKEIDEVCKFKPSIKDVERGEFGENSCEYYLQKYIGLTSAHSLWNYHSYFQIKKYNQKTFAEYLDRKASVFDEAHKIEDQINQFVGIDVFSGQLQECGIDSTKSGQM